MTTRAMIAVVLSGMMAASCAPTVCLPPPEVALPATFETTAVIQPSAASLDAWWLAFDDVQLTALVDAALVASPDARLAYARLREARAIRSQTIRGTLPTGDLTASAVRQYTRQLSSNLDSLALGGTGTDGGLGDLFNPTGAIDTYNVALNASWELDVFGRLAATRRQARDTFAASVLDYQATRLSLSADIAIALFEARGYAAQLDNARETLRVTRELADTARLGVERGLLAGSDAARLETDAASAEAERLRLQNALDTSKRTLLVLSGRATAPLDTVTIAAQLGPAPPLPAVVPGQLLDRRPDVRAAGARLAAATAKVKVDRLALFPRFDLRPGAAFSSSNSPIGATNLLWSVGAGLGLPILDRPRLLAQLRVTQAQGEQAVIQYEQAVQTAYREADRALALVAADRDRQVALDRAAARARYAFDAARTGYRLGLTDLTALLQAEQAWRTANVTATNLRAAALQDVVTAFRALGGGWTPIVDPDAAGVALTAQAR